MRYVMRLRAEGDERAALALDMYVYRLRKYIGAYMAALQPHRTDALVFSGGVGENAPEVRRLVCEGMQVGEPQPSS